MSNKESSIFTTAKVLNMLSTYPEEEKIRWISECKKNEDATISDHKHKICTGRALTLVKRMLVCGASKEEMYNPMKHLYLCINARKYNLDVDESAKDLVIKDYREKYKRITEEPEEDI